MKRAKNSKGRPQTSKCPPKKSGRANARNRKKKKRSSRKKRIVTDHQTWAAQARHDLLPAIIHKQTEMSVAEARTTAAAIIQRIYKCLKSQFKLEHDVHIYPGASIRAITGYQVEDGLYAARWKIEMSPESTDPTNFFIGWSFEILSKLE